MSSSRILYAETLPAMILRVALGGSAMLIFSVAALLPAEPTIRILIALTGVAELLVMFALNSLTIEVREDALELRFGSGWLRRSYPIEKIASAKAQKWSWLRGAGIHMGLRGSMYLLTRGEVVEMRLESGWRIVFSCESAQRVLRALSEAGVADIDPPQR